MKELIHLTHYGSFGCAMMQETLLRVISKNPELKYSKIDASEDSALYEYYVKKYNLPNEFPIFLGLVDGHLQDGHIGTGGEIVIESLFS